MNLTIFLLILAALSVASLVIGYTSSKGAKTQGEYFLNNRSLSFLALAMTFLATQVGGGSLMGAAEEAYIQGWKVLFYPMGMVFGLLILGLGFGRKMRNLNLTTVAEIFEKKFNSKALRQVASLLSIGSLCFILVAQGIAAKKFFISLGFEGPWLFISFWAVLVCYTVLGGLKAVIRTDILQAGFIMVSFAVAMIAKAVSTTPDIVSAPIISSGGSVPWSTWLLMPLLFMLIEQDMGQRCFAAKSPRTISFAAITSAIILLLCSVVPIYFGTLAAKMGIAVPAGSSVLISAILSLTNPVIASLLMSAIFMAIISTADSLLCSISSNLACDFLMLKKGSEKAKLVRAKVGTALIGLGTMGLPFLFDNVVAMLMFSYELAVSVLFVPVMMGVFVKNPNKRSAIVAMCVGGAAFLLFRAYSPSLVPKELITIGLATTSFVALEWKQKRVLLQKPEEGC